MTIDELREKLSIVNNENSGAVAYFILKDGDAFKIRMIDIQAEALGSLKQCFASRINSAILDITDSTVEELELLKISTADERKNALYEYDLETIPAELTFLTTIDENEEQDTFSSTTDNLNKLFGYVIAIGVGDEKVLIFKKHTPVSAFKPDKFFIFESNHRFVKLDSTMIRLDPNFELLLVDEKIIIRKLETLEKYAGFHDVIKREATASIEVINNSGIVDNAETLQDMVENVAFARKLVKATKDSPVLGIIPVSAIVKFVKKHPKLKKKIKLTEDKRQLSLITIESKKQFLKLLNDDYLRSELTEAYYDSLAKDQLKIQE